MPRTLEASATYNPESKYLEVTVTFGDEESYLPGEIKELLITPLNSKGHALCPSFPLDGEYGNADGLIYFNMSRIAKPSKVKVLLTDKEGLQYGMVAYPQIEQPTEIGSQVYSDELHDDPQGVDS